MKGGNLKQMEEREKKRRKMRRRMRRSRKRNRILRIECPINADFLWPWFGPLGNVHTSLTK